MDRIPSDQLGGLTDRTGGFKISTVLAYDAAFRRYSPRRVCKEKGGGAKEGLRKSLGGRAKEPI